MASSLYPSLSTNSYLHPHPSFLSQYTNTTPTSSRSSHGLTNSTTSPSSSSVEPVTPELSPPQPHTAGMGDDRRVSDASAQSNEDAIECKWAACDFVSPSPDELYDHLCNVHVGRKSTGNLNLTCGWEGCGVKCVKRDHITSHLRVHTPLKPHPCAVCSKTFKRPQDLKKHERIHTQEHHLLHKLSKATTTSDPAFNQRVTSQSSVPMVNPPSFEPYRGNQHDDHSKSVSPTPSALAALHRKQHEELAAYQQREMMMLQQLAFQQQQTQAYAAQFASEGASDHGNGNGSNGHHLNSNHGISSGFGTSNNRGMKRSTDDNFVDLWSDMKKRKVEPVYDTGMIARLNSMVPPSLPQLNTLPHNGGLSSSYNNTPQSTSSYNSFSNYSSGNAFNHSSMPTNSLNGGMGAGLPSLGSLNNLSTGLSGGGGGGGELDALPFPDIRTDSDLAMFNQFMISLGRDAALGGSPNIPMAHSGSFGSSFSTSSVSSGSPLSGQSPMEDLFNPEELASLGLGGMPGIPPLPPAAMPSTVSFGNMYPSFDSIRSRTTSVPDFGNDVSKRQIAGLPRNHSLSQAGMSRLDINLPSYPELPLGPSFDSITDAATSNSTSSLSGGFDFDSLARSKAPVNATIQPRDFYKKTYRHVAPLGASVSSRSRLSESALRTEVDLDAEDYDHEHEHERDDDEDEDDHDGLAASPEEMDTPKISVRSLLTSDDLPDGEDLRLPAIHSPHDDEHRDLPSVKDIEGYKPPAKRHTEEEIVRGVKRLELEGGSPSPGDNAITLPRLAELRLGSDRPLSAEESQRRRHAALIRAWLVAVNLDYRKRRLGDVERRMAEGAQA